MTECNWHTIQDMKRHATELGVELVIAQDTEGDMAGWWSARYSNQDESAAWFMEIGDRCAC